MTRIVAIHQPNFFPWLGYFDKIRRADVFVFLDDVQFQKTGGTWTNRVRLLDRDRPCWLTAPVDRGFHGVRPINEMTFVPRADWASQCLAKIEGCYGKAPFFAASMALLRPLFLAEERNLAKFNMHAIGQLLHVLDLKDRELLCSSAIPSDARSTDRLVEITKRVGGTHYLYGGGAEGYQEDAKFAQAGLQLVRQGFDHPRYPQPAAEFVPGLSIIDLLMHCGHAAAAQLIASSGSAAGPARAD